MCATVCVRNLFYFQHKSVINQNTMWHFNILLPIYLNVSEHLHSHRKFEQGSTLCSFFFLYCFHSSTLQMAFSSFSAIEIIRLDIVECRQSGTFNFCSHFFSRSLPPSSFGSSEKFKIMVCFTFL